MAALRRNDEDKRARDARKARLVERARETRQSPGSDCNSGSGRGAAASERSPLGGPAERHPADALSAGSPSPMGPAGTSTAPTLVSATARPSAAAARPISGRGKAAGDAAV